MYRILMLTLAMAASAYAQGGFNGPGLYEIVGIDSNRVIDLDRKDRRTVIQFEARGTENQRWELREGPGATWYLINAMNGAALDQVTSARSTPVEATPFADKASQRWKIERAKDGNAILLSFTGLALDIPDRSKKDGVRIQVYDLNGEGNQRFYFRRVTPGGVAVDSRPSLRGPRGTQGGEGSVPAPVSPPAVSVPSNGVCLYREPDFKGDVICARTGEDLDDLTAGRVASVKFYGKTHEIDVFAQADFRGKRVRVVGDMPDLSKTTQLSNAPIGSVRVY